MQQMIGKQGKILIDVFFFCNGQLVVVWKWQLGDTFDYCIDHFIIVLIFFITMSSAK